LVVVVVVVVVVVEAAAAAVVVVEATAAAVVVVVVVVVVEAAAVVVVMARPTLIEILMARYSHILSNGCLRIQVLHQMAQSSRSVKHINPLKKKRIYFI
jgi:hypothetical protein